jgi:TetR/AcrR family transcriptional regulator, transcriptional repressor for nem operon
MRDRVNRFFTTHPIVAENSETGGARGEFKFAGSVSKTTRLILGALQGALIVKRTTGHTSHVKDVVAVLKSQLTSA